LRGFAVRRVAVRLVPLLLPPRVAAGGLDGRDGATARSLPVRLDDGAGEGAALGVAERVGVRTVEPVVALDEVPRV
jgi:hypothetical protein